MRIIATIALLALGLQASAQNFTARVNRTNVSVGENFQLTFEIQGDASRFNPPPLNDFMLLSGPNKSSNMQWVNGNFSSSITYSFILRPVKEGEFVIGPASVEIDGKVMQTDPITMNVGKGRSRPQQAPSPQGNPSSPQSSNGDLDDQIASNIFMKLFVDKKDVFVGEQVLATYKLYLNVNVMDYEFSNLVFNGFYAEDLKVDGSSSVTNEVINGRQFQVHTLKQTLLTPQKSGDIDVPALESDMVIRVRESRRSRSLFDQVFGNYKNARISLESNTESIKVRPLPAEGQPSGFSGAVGSFKLRTTADRNQVPANEAINVTVEIEGNGNLELISPPEIDFPADFESYDPKVKNEVTTTARGSKGSKSYEYVVIPRFEGEYSLGPVTFSYFDPAKKSYQVLRSDKIDLSITPGSGQQGGVAYAAPKKEDVQIIGKDIRFIHTDDADLRRKESRFFGSPLFYALTVLPFAGMGAAIFFVSFYRAQQSDTKSLKSKRARGVAKKHLAEAKKRMTGEDEAFYDAISSALFGYISDKLSIDRSELNRDRIEEELNDAGVSEETRTSLKKALDECEMVRFAPGVVRGKEEMLAMSTEIIEHLEDEV